MRKAWMVLGIVGLLAGSACGGGSSDGDDKPAATTPGGQKPAVSIKGLGTTWEPDDITIKPGDIVEWNVTGSIVHDLKGDEDVFHKASSKFKYTHKYEDAGTFSYQCTIHAGMTGTITVEP